MTKLPLSINSSVNPMFALKMDKKFGVYRGIAAADIADAAIAQKALKIVSMDSELVAVSTFDRNPLQMSKTVEPALE